MTTHSRLTHLRDKIDTMDATNHIQVLRIIKEYGDPSAIQETNHGVHTNLADLPEAVIQKIEQYVTYYYRQEERLKQLDDATELVKRTHFNGTS